MRTIVILNDWTKDLWDNNVLIPVYTPAYKMKVPETWEELKSFCEKTENQTSDISCDISNDEIEITIWNIDGSYKVGNFKFYYDGDSVHLYMDKGFSIPIKIPKIWMLIQSLISEVNNR